MLLQTHSILRESVSKTCPLPETNPKTFSLVEKETGTQRPACQTKPVRDMAWHGICTISTIMAWVWYKDMGIEGHHTDRDTSHQHRTDWVPYIPFPLTKLIGYVDVQWDERLQAKGWTIKYKIRPLKVMYYVLTLWLSIHIINHWDIRASLILVPPTPKSPALN